MSQEVIDRLGEISDKLDAIAGQLKDNTERTEAAAKLMEDVHRAWCLESNSKGASYPRRRRQPSVPGL